jgi:release factor glutamine methyltransferase
LGLKIDLSLRTFIPRPETEYWVASAIEYLASAKCDDLKVLDLCCGSGCVGISVLKKIKGSCVRFVDIDPRAVRQTRINLKLNAIDSKRAKVTQGDLFEKLPSDACYDAILANPPYIDKKRAGEVQSTVLKYEPPAALWGGGKNGMSLITKIIAASKRFLADGGVLYLEFDASQRDQIESLLIKRGYVQIEFFKDQFEKLRFARAVVTRHLDKSGKYI